MTAPRGDFTHVELQVSGMHCPSCVALIEQTLRQDPAVHDVTVDLDAARASVAFEESIRSVDDLCEAVRGAGYNAVPVASADPAP